MYVEQFKSGMGILGTINMCYVSQGVSFANVASNQFFWSIFVHRLSQANLKSSDIFHFKLKRTPEIHSTSYFNFNFVLMKTPVVPDRY